MFIFSQIELLRLIAPDMKRTIGLLFDTPDDYPDVVGPADRFAEFEPESTLLVMEEAVRLAGCTPVRIGAPSAMLVRRPQVDIIWNISEGYGSRNRESWAPVLAEMWGIPCLGSDALTLSLSLDKHRTKQVARGLGVPTADWTLLQGSAGVDAVLPEWYPVFAKPRYEGTAKGIGTWSRCVDSNALAELTDRLVSMYHQDVLVEPWLPGGEYTVALIGSPLKVQPVLERALHGPTGIGIHAISAHDPNAITHSTTSDSIPPELEQNLKDWSLQLCHEMDVRHFARLDFKCDHQNNLQFLEINPLPTFAADNTFGILAEISGQTPASYLSYYLSECLNDYDSAF